MKQIEGKCKDCSIVRRDTGTAGVGLPTSIWKRSDGGLDPNSAQQVSRRDIGRIYHLATQLPRYSNPVITWTLGLSPDFLPHAPPLRASSSLVKPAQASKGGGLTSRNDSEATPFAATVADRRVQGTNLDGVALDLHSNPHISDGGDRL